MPSLKEFVKTYSGKKEITDLPKISVDINVFDGEFEKNGTKMKYSYLELDGYKYSLKAQLLRMIKEFIEKNPNAKYFKVMKSPSGEMFPVSAD